MEDLSKFPLIASFVAGILTFISPCILPLIPAFISFITGVSLDELKESSNSIKPVFFKTLVFVLGFSAVFITLGMSASWLGGLFVGSKEILRYIGGAVIILFGLHLTGIIKIPFLNKQLSANGKISSKTGWFGIFFIGCAFALGWTPCVGPILSSILLLASTQGSVINGFFLLLVYSLGLGIPFLLTSLFIDWFLRFFNFIKKYYHAIEVVSGVLLIAVGILIITDGFTHVTMKILQFFS